MTNVSCHMTIGGGHVTRCGGHMSCGGHMTRGELDVT